MPSRKLLLCVLMPMLASCAASEATTPAPNSASSSPARQETDFVPCSSLTVGQVSMVNDTLETLAWVLPLRDVILKRCPENN